MLRLAVTGAIFMLSHAYDFTDFHSVDLWGSSNDDTKPHFQFYYKLDGNKATLGAEVETKDGQWFSVGLTSSGGMIGADLAIFTPADRDGKEYTVGDYWSEGFYAPSQDDNQNLVLLDSSTTHGITTVVWERQVDSCDQEEDLDMLRHRNVIFAIGYGEHLSYHKYRGGITVDWLNGPAAIESKESALEDDVVVQTFQPEEALAIDGDVKTQYKCMSGPMSLPQDYHSVKMQPIVDSRFVHHMIFYVCPTETVVYGEEETRHGQVVPCGVMPPSGCRSVGAWAVGGQPLYNHKEYGLRIPQNTQSWVIQFHYDNYNLEEGGLDRSGARFYLTPTLRPNDLGNLVLGVPAADTPEISLEPGHETIELTSEMPAGCTEKMAEEAVQIVGIGFHMHKYGKYAYLEHWRDGTRLPDIGWKHWDFNFQTPEILEPEDWVEVRRGDELRLHCLYDTTDAEQVVKGGDGSDDEMCLVFLQHFPPMEVQVSFQMDKVLTMAGKGDKTLCIARPGVQDGLGIGGGKDQGNRYNFQKLMKQMVDKSLTETSPGRLIDPRECAAPSAPSTTTTGTKIDATPLTATSEAPKNEADTNPTTQTADLETEATTDAGAATADTKAAAKTQDSDSEPAPKSKEDTSSSPASEVGINTQEKEEEEEALGALGEGEDNKDSSEAGSVGPGDVTVVSHKSNAVDDVVPLVAPMYAGDTNSARGSSGLSGTRLILVGLLQAVIVFNFVSL